MLKKNSYIADWLLWHSVSSILGSGDGPRGGPWGLVWLSSSGIGSGSGSIFTSSMMGFDGMGELDGGCIGVFCCMFAAAWAACARKASKELLAIAGGPRGGPWWPILGGCTINGCGFVCGWGGGLECDRERIPNSWFPGESLSWWCVWWWVCWWFEVELEWFKLAAADDCN